MKTFAEVAGRELTESELQQVRGARFEHFPIFGRDCGGRGDWDSDRDWHRWDDCEDGGRWSYGYREWYRRDDYSGC